MRTLTFLGIIYVGLVFSVQAQGEVLKVSVDRDTLTREEMLEYRIVLENSSGKLELPSFQGFSVISGPNTSSSYSVINGKVSQSKTWQIYLKPSRTGAHSIPPATITTQHGRLESQAMQVYVVDTDEAGNRDIPSGTVQENGKKFTTTPIKRVLRKI